MLFKNFNLVFTKVTEERTEELKELINLMDDLCEDFTPILQLITDAAEAGINTIEFAGDVGGAGDELQYLGAKRFGASCTILAKKIIIDADMSYASEVFQSILFELGNAVNAKLHLANEYAKYKNADEYADTMEEKEFNTVLNTEKLIIKLLQAKPESVNNLIKQLNIPSNYQEMLEESQEVANYTFEDSKIKFSTYSEHRDYYAKWWFRNNTIKDQLKTTIVFDEISPKHSSTIVDPLAHALKANDKELIKTILNDSILQIRGDSLGPVCNIGDLEIVDMFLERVDKIELEIFSFDELWKEWDKNILNKVLKSSKNVVDEFYLRMVLDNRNSETVDSVLKCSSIKEVKENLFSRALEKGYLKYIEKLTPYMPQKNEYMEIANSTGKPEIIEIISKHLQPLLDVSIELHQECSLIHVDIEYTSEILLMDE